MADQRGRSLHYGSLGKVSYDKDKALWTCERFPAQLSRTEVLRHDYSIQDESHKVVHSFRHDSSHHERERLELLAEEMTDLPAALPTARQVINEDRQIEEPVIRLSGSYTGQLLAFGVARGLRYTSSSPLRVVAYPNGRNRSDLCIAQMMPVISGLDVSDSPNVSVESMRAMPSPNPTWHCTSGVILQIIFSDAKEDAHMFLAVRSSTCLHVLRPRATKSPVKGGNNRSRINAHAMAAEKLVDIRLTRLLGSTCTDVAFNPWYQHQLVVVDDTGAYAIVQISSRKTRKGHSWSVFSRGGVKTPTKKNVAQRAQFFRVVWLHDVHTFIVGGRRTIFLLDVRAPQSPLAQLQMSSDVVDVGISPFHKDDVFVLTRSHIEWLRLTTSLDGSNEFAQLTSWRHYLQPALAGIKLSFCQHEDSPDTGSVLIYSRNAFVVAEYPLSSAPDVLDQQWITCRPSSFYAPSSVKLPSRALDLELQAVPIVSAGLNVNLPARSIGHLFQLFILDSSNNLNAYFCSKESRSSHQDHVVLATATRSRRWEGNVRNRDLDEWLVSDDTSAASGVDAEIMLSASSPSSTGDFSESSSMSSRNADAMPASQYVSGISYADVYDKLAADNDQPEADLSTAVAHVLLGEARKSQNVHLFEHVNTNITIHDLDQATNLLKATTEGSYGGIPLPETSNIQKMSLPAVEDLRLLNSDTLELSEMYDLIVQRWIAPLSEDVPARTRIRLEQVARSFTASIWLSSHYLGDGIASRQADEQHATVTSRSRASSEQPLSNLKHLSLSSDTTGASQSQETFNSSQANAGTSSRANKPSVVSEADVGNATALRLSRYTKVNKPLSASDVTTSILNHWSEGSDPNQYDYKSEIAAASGTANIAGSQMSPETYARQKRREKRQEERRLQREMKRLRTSQALSSAPASSAFSQPGSQPAMVSGRQDFDRSWQSSQPVAPPDFGSSQPTSRQHLDVTDQSGPAGSGQELHMASQVQPGRHGARPLPGSLAVRAKNKRKAGF